MAAHSHFGVCFRGLRDAHHVMASRNCLTPPYFSLLRLNLVLNKPYHYIFLLLFLLNILLFSFLQAGDDKGGGEAEHRDGKEPVAENQVEYEEDYYGDEYYDFQHDVSYYFLSFVC
jgi:hypothetical protein